MSGVVERYGMGDWRWRLYVRWMWVCSVSSLKEWREEDGGGQGSKGKSGEDCMLGVSFSFGIPSPPSILSPFCVLVCPRHMFFSGNLQGFDRAAVLRLGCLSHFFSRRGRTIRAPSPDFSNDFFIQPLFFSPSCFVPSFTL